MRLLGSHMSVAGGVDKAIERGLSINCTAIQIFVKNNNQWFGKPFQEDEIQRFIMAQKQSNLFVFAHAGYLINLASSGTENHTKSMQSMREELERCEKLGISFVVLHPGSHLGQGVEIGIKNVVNNINQLIAETKGYKVMILLETTAGQGTGLGSSFNELGQIITQVNDTARIGVCFDTCHVFAAGYDIKTKEGYEKTWEEFQDNIGLNKLYAFHLNDSKGPLASHKDRHEHIGKGELGIEAFRLLMNDDRFKNLPMVLETPKDPDMQQDVENLKVLNSLI
ncbi:MAG: deoxyribonuclease IV [Candidatus Margulisiibacteriota bacterium]